MERGEISSVVLSQPDKMDDTPVDSPGETSSDIPGESSGDQPVDSPSDTSHDKPCDTPGDKTCDTPAEKPGETSCDTTGDTRPGELLVDKPSDKSCAKKGKMSQFDKFKRRLIRSVARMLITEKMEPDQAWQTLEKETGRDCKSIWTHMRALTLRKLSRLLAADDYVARVGEVAKMSPVDWLQFDLVLVHEDIDVWDLGTASKKQIVDLSAPWDLLQLAYQHDVIHAFGEQLALTWATITVHYNRKGRQCSPMLIQKRWHQLLRQARDKFYVFWYEYRGVDTKINHAMEYAPNTLEYTIAKCYPKLVTKQFPNWLDAMQEGEHRIVLLDELQKVMRDKQRENLIEDGPELVLMEPKIDTIEIGDDSDEENADDDKADENKPNEAGNVVRNKNNTRSANVDNTTASDEDSTKATDEVSAPPKVKTEPLDEHTENLDPDDGLSNIKIVTAAHVTTAEIVDNDLAQLVLIDNTNNDINLDENSKDDDIEKVVLSPDHASHEVATIQNLETNAIEAVTKIPDLNTDKQNSAISDLELLLISTDDTNMSTADSNTNKTDLNIPEDLNTNETDLNSPETDIINNERELSEEPNITTSIQDEPLIRQTFETSNGSCNNTSNICIADTRSLSNDNTTDGSCSEVQDMIVKTEHGSQEDIVKLQLVPEEQIENNLPNFVITEDTITTINIETNDPEEPVLINTRTLNDAVSIANPCLLTSDLEEDIIMYDPSLNVTKEVALESVLGDDAEPMEIVDEGVDDGEYLADEAYITDTTAKSHNTSGNSDDQPPKIDVKLIMNAIVFTTKLESMKSLKNKSFEEVKSDALINEVLEESKPVIKLQTIVEDKVKLKVTTDKNFKIDAIDQLSHEIINNKVPKPIDYNKTNDETNMEVKMEIDGNEEENIETNSEHKLTEMDVGQDEQESSEDEYEDVRINPNSKLFKKPNNVSYNPVQLCKNPDFNTRLKRIPILFYTYKTNKEYLKECKPLTIDLDKGFEKKMHNKTIYLKRDPNAVRVKIAPKINSNVPITGNIHETNQHISDNQPTNAQAQGDLTQIKLETTLDITDEELISERKRKLISLHDIVKVRRINQQLLTAEISPILTNESNKSKSCETIDLTSKPDASSITEMNLIKKEPAEPLTLYKPNETMTTPLNQQPLNQQPIEPIAQSSKIPKPKVVPKKPTPRWYQIKPTKPVEKLPAINETVTQKVKRIYGDSLLTDDSVNKMLLILETDALDDEHVKKFFSCKIQPVAPCPSQKKIRIRKPKPTTEVVDRNINKDELNNIHNLDDRDKKILKEVEKRIRDLENKQKKKERESARREKLKLKAIEEFNLNEKKKQVLTPKINIAHQDNKTPYLLTIGESESTKPNVPEQKKVDIPVKFKMLCRTPVQCHSTPAYSLRGFDNGPKVSVFSDHHGHVRRPRSGGLSFLVKDNVKKNLTISPVILRTIGNNKHSEKLTYPKQTEIKPSRVPLSREQVKLNIKQRDVVLSAKFLSMFPANSSFGKDKIILTTANLDCFAEEPSPVKATPAPIVHSDSQQLFPPFEVPEGVRFYLTATGDVVGTVDAWITNPLVTNAIPLYVSTIKEILASASTSTMDVSESSISEISNLKATVDPVNTAKDITESDTENLAATESVPTTIDITQRDISENMTSAATLTKPVEISEFAAETDKIVVATESIAATTEINQSLDKPTATKLDIPVPTESNLMNICQISETITQSNDTISHHLKQQEKTDTVMTEKQPSKLQVSIDSASLPVCDSTGADITETNQTDLVSAVGQKKSILSDLMAMTGITSEDIMSSKPEVEETPMTISPVTNIMPVSNIISVTPLVEPTPYDLFSDLASQNANTNANLKMLTPVTSFEMLKYANNESGEFYKLDLTTGIILPITVGFKRVKTYAKINNKMTLQTHATIDLTEEGEDSNLSGSNDQSKSEAMVTGIKTHVLKRVIAPKATNRDDDEELPVTIVCRPQPRSRKQNLRPRTLSTHIDGIVNLSEFDEPVEEEYLEDSQDSQLGTEPEYEEAEMEFDEATEELSSDEDEPLSAVIRRRDSKARTSSDVVAVTRDLQSEQPIDEDAVDNQSKTTSQKQRVLNFDLDKDMDGGLVFDPSFYAAMNPSEGDECTNVSDGSASIGDCDSSTNDNESDEDFILGV